MEASRFKRQARPDASDTSPYRTNRPVTGISTATCIAIMVLLIELSRRRD